MTTLATITDIRNLFNNKASAAPAGLRAQAVVAAQAGDSLQFLAICKAAGIDGISALHAAFSVFPEMKVKAKAEAEARAEAKAEAKADLKQSVRLAIKEVEMLVKTTPRKRKFAGAFAKASIEVVAVDVTVEAPVVDVEVDVEVFVEVSPIKAIRLVPPVFNAAVAVTAATAVGLGPIAPATAILAATLTAILEEEKGALSAGVVGIVGGLAVLAATSVITPLGVLALAPIAGVAVIGGILSKIRS